MRIHIDAKVYCGDTLCGKVSCVIVKPSSDELTHFVVSEKRLEFPASEHLVSIKHIVESDSDKVVLDCTPEELSDMERFVTQEFVPSGEEITGYGSEQLRQPVMQMTEVAHENIPGNEVAVHKGAAVFAAGQRIGKIDEFLVDSNKPDRITHIVLREGHLWHARNISIPVSEIEKIDTDEIHLKLSHDEVEELPSMKVHGWFN